jgi:uncharacterized protein (DUF305 family)
MRTHLKTIAFAMLFALPGVAFAQTDTHHSADAANAQTQMMSPEMMQSMMKMMQNCMGMMQMMQTGMGQGMPMQGGMQGNMPMQGGLGQNMPMMQGGMSEAQAAYMASMSKMDAPMMQAMQISDPDVAFVKGMIPHHQGAIDMAKVVLQYGKDDTVKAWANQIIAAQEKEIAEMQDWLKTHGE